MKSRLLSEVLLTMCAAGRLWGGEFKEDFSTDPLLRGWDVFGDRALFAWDIAAQNLEVTWDSTQANSYFWHPLGTVLTRNDDVQLALDLELEDVAIGVTPGQPFTFELAVGLLNEQNASSTNFVRGTGLQASNIMEFDYFPDSGFGATISPTIVSSNGQFATSFTFPLPLDPGALFHIEMIYSAKAQTLTTAMQRNGETFANIKTVVLPATFTDFRVDTVAIASYSDRGADGSILAHGWIDNISVQLPDPPVVEVQLQRGPARWQVQFSGQTGWSYVLERTTDLKQWKAVAAAVTGTGQPQSIEDDQPVAEGSAAFYRLREERL